MKKLRIIIGLLCVLCVFGLDTQMISAESTGDVAINENNFPDASLRESLTKTYNADENCDAILTPEEIQSVIWLEISAEHLPKLNQYGCDLTGIEHLKNLKRVYIHGEGVIKGTFHNNMNLSEVVFNRDFGKSSQQEIEQLFPLEQINNLTLEYTDIKKLSLSKAVKLETLVVDNCENLKALDLRGAVKLETLVVNNCKNLKALDLRGAKNLKRITVQNCVSLKTLNVSGNKHLECLTLDNTSVKNLNLTKNTKLKTVSVQSGFSCVWTDLITGEKETIPFFREIKNSCKIQFPKKNKITELNYFTMDKELDISKCKKLKKIYVSKNTKLKTDSKWYKRNRKKLAVYAEGFRQKKLKVQNKKKSILLKAMKVKEEDHVYYCEETDGEQY